MKADPTPSSIVVLSSPDVSQTGDFVYRVRQPGIALGAQGVRVVSISSISGLRKRLIQDCDVLVVDMVGDADLVPELAGRRGPTIYEMSDNIFDIQPWNAVHGFFADSHNRSTIMQVLTLCDGVHTTSSHLTDLFGRWHPQIRTLRNQLAHVPPLEPKDGPLVIGWGGSFGHLGDMAAIAPAITAWLHERPDVKLHLMCHERIFDLFSGVPSHQKRHFPTGPLAAYEHFLDTVHVGLVPVEERGFNLCRSDVKFLEFAAHGAVAVCRNIGPYAEAVRHDETGILYEDVDELVAWLDRLAGDPERVARIRSAAYDYVALGRQEHQHVDERLEFYGEAIARRGAPLGGDRRLDWLAEDPRAREVAPGYFEVPFDEAERAIYTGLALASRPEDAPSAAAHFERAAHLAPDHPLAGLYLAHGRATAGDLEGALEALDGAARRDHASFQAQILRTIILGRAGRSEDAQAHVRRCHEAHPDNARMGLAWARTLGDQGDRGGRRQALEQVVQAAPGYIDAYAELGMACFQGQDSAGAKEALGTYLQYEPRHTQARFVFACCTLQTGDVDGGRALLEEIVASEPDHAQARGLLDKLNQGARP